MGGGFGGPRKPVGAGAAKPNSGGGSGGQDIGDRKLIEL